MAVVFTDNYTVGANTNIDAYPAAGADYAYNAGSGAACTVNAANDRVQRTTGGVSWARIIDGAVPTGDQEATADCRTQDVGFESGFVVCRGATGATDDCYNGYVELGTANEVLLYRRDAGTATLLASADQGLSGTQTVSMVLRATGSATVALTLTVNGGTAVTANDSTASRKTSGPPGVGGGSDGTFDSAVDNLSIDDLTAAVVAGAGYYIRCMRWAQNV